MTSNPIIFHCDIEKEKKLFKNNPDSPINSLKILFKDNGSLSTAPLIMGNKFLYEISKTENAIYPIKSNIEKLIRLAGGVPIGTSKTPEMSLCAVTELTWSEPLENAWNTNKTAGGSSGGAAVAAAKGLAPICLASDGGGSIRMPASLNGVLGIKPTRGRISNGPIDSEHWSGLATAGVITQYVKNLANTLKVISEPFVDDPYYHENNIREYSELDLDKLRNNKIGYCEEVPNNLCEINSKIIEILFDAIDFFSKQNFIIEKSFPKNYHDENIRDTFLQIISSHTYKSASDLLNLTKAKLEDLEPETQLFYNLGKNISAKSYITSRDNMYRWGRKYKQWFNNFDILLTPVTACLTPDIGDYYKNPIEVSNQLTVFTYHANMSGLPSISIPWAFPNDNNNLETPVGIMLTAAPYKENVLLNLAKLIEEEHPWSQNYKLIN